MEPDIVAFASRAEFQQQLRLCLARARSTLQLFDPDFALWELGHSEVEAVLRQFLAGQGRLQLALHDPQHLERHCPRFLRLLLDYSHLVECRRTSKGLRQLTDSFCIGDARHLVRRFHSDHLRGEAVADAPAATQVCGERFAGIWEEATVVLQGGILGL